MQYKKKHGSNSHNPQKGFLLNGCTTLKDIKISFVFYGPAASKTTEEMYARIFVTK